MPQDNHSIRERFLKAYANLPLSARHEIIAVLEEGPVTWQVTYFEVMNDTPKGREILEQIEKLAII